MQTRNSRSSDIPVLMLLQAQKGTDDELEPQPECTLRERGPSGTCVRSGGSSVPVCVCPAASFSAAPTSGSFGHGLCLLLLSPDALVLLPPELSEPAQRDSLSPRRTGAARPHGNCWVRGQTATDQEAEDA